MTGDEESSSSLFFFCPSFPSFAKPFYVERPRTGLCGDKKPESNFARLFFLSFPFPLLDHLLDTLNACLRSSFSDCLSLCSGHAASQLLLRIQPRRTIEACFSPPLISLYPCGRPQCTCESTTGAARRSSFLRVYKHFHPGTSPDVCVDTKARPAERQDENKALRENPHETSCLPVGLPLCLQTAQYARPRTVYKPYQVYRVTPGRIFPLSAGP